MAWPGGEIHHIDVKLDPIISKFKISQSENLKIDARREKRVG